MTVLERSIDDIAKAIIRLKYGGKLSVEEINSKKEDIGLKEKVIDGIFNVVVENLPDDKVKELDTILDDGDEEKIELFFKENMKNIPNLNELVMSALKNIENTI